MNAYIMQKFIKSALRALARGISEYTIFGKLPVRIEHMHDDEYGAMIFDPVTKDWKEIMRMYQSTGEYILA